MKDTVLVPVNGYIVVRFRSDNPGYWLLHCQNDQHMNEGMALVLREAADRHPSPPEGFPRCGDFTWSSAENEHALGGEEARRRPTTTRPLQAHRERVVVIWGPRGRERIVVAGDSRGTGLAGITHLAKKTCNVLA
ncbi:Hypp9558 [Branchiostoma lanceolatum]|uniref:Hypp9558 protein n=1 Tax=Branchiostoma lanceolatum TaxID=7740 RepID=A0A8S4MNG3_BRALA|nr:Hypp9558 [Branchiostoma lanceolatum]